MEKPHELPASELHDRKPERPFFAAPKLDRKDECSHFNHGASLTPEDVVLERASLRPAKESKNGSGVLNIATVLLTLQSEVDGARTRNHRIDSPVL
jgi:hypothetical protein